MSEELLTVRGVFTAGKLPQNVPDTPSKKVGTVYRTVPHGHDTGYNKPCAKKIAGFPEILFNTLIDFSER
jgi:hypothetical protein